MEFGLEFMAVIGADRMDSERKLGDYVINEVNGVSLRVPGVDLQSSDACCIVIGRIREPLHLLPIRAFEFQKFDVNLDMVTRYLLFISFCLDRALLGILGQPAHAIPFQNIPNARGGNLDFVISGQKPGYPLLAKVILLPQIKYLLLNFWRRSEDLIDRAGLLVYQPCFAVLLKGFLPLIKCLPTYSKIPACLRYITNGFCMVQDPELSADVPLSLCHEPTPVENEAILSNCHLRS